MISFPQGYVISRERSSQQRYSDTRRLPYQQQQHFYGVNISAANKVRTFENQIEYTYRTPGLLAPMQTAPTATIELPNYQDLINHPVYTALDKSTTSQRMKFRTSVQSMSQTNFNRDVSKSLSIACLNQSSPNTTLVNSLPSVSLPSVRVPVANRSMRIARGGTAYDHVKLPKIIAVHSLSEEDLAVLRCKGNNLSLARCSISSDDGPIPVSGTVQLSTETPRGTKEIPYVLTKDKQVSVAAPRMSKDPCSAYQNTLLLLEEKRQRSREAQKTVENYQNSNVFQSATITPEASKDSVSLFAENGLQSRTPDQAGANRAALDKPQLSKESPKGQKQNDQVSDETPITTLDTALDSAHNKRKALEEWSEAVRRTTGESSSSAFSKEVGKNHLQQGTFGKEIRVKSNNVLKSTSSLTNHSEEIKNDKVKAILHDVASECNLLYKQRLLKAFLKKSDQLQVVINKERSAEKKGKLLKRLGVLREKIRLVKQNLEATPVYETVSKVKVPESSSTKQDDKVIDCGEKKTNNDSKKNDRSKDALCFSTSDKDFALLTPRHVNSTPAVEQSSKVLTDCDIIVVTDYESNSQFLDKQSGLVVNDKDKDKLRRSKELDIVTGTSKLAEHKSSTACKNAIEKNGLNVNLRTITNKEIETAIPALETSMNDSCSRHKEETLSRNLFDELSCKLKAMEKSTAFELSCREEIQVNKAEREANGGDTELNEQGIKVNDEGIKASKGQIMLNGKDIHTNALGSDTDDKVVKANGEGISESKKSKRPNARLIKVNGEGIEAIERVIETNGGASKSNKRSNLINGEGIKTKVGFIDNEREGIEANTGDIETNEEGIKDKRNCTTFKEGVVESNDRLIKTNGEVSKTSEVGFGDNTGNVVYKEDIKANIGGVDFNDSCEIEGGSNKVKQVRSKLKIGDSEIASSKNIISDSREQNYCHSQLIDGNDDKEKKSTTLTNMEEKITYGNRKSSKPQKHKMDSKLMQLTDTSAGHDTNEPTHSLNDTAVAPDSFTWLSYHSSSSASNGGTIDIESTTGYKPANKASPFNLAHLTKKNREYHKNVLRVNFMQDYSYSKSAKSTKRELESDGNKQEKVCKKPRKSAPRKVWKNLNRGKLEGREARSMKIKQEQCNDDCPTDKETPIIRGHAHSSLEGDSNGNAIVESSKVQNESHVRRDKLKAEAVCDVVIDSIFEETIDPSRFHTSEDILRSVSELRGTNLRFQQSHSFGLCDLNSIEKEQPTVMKGRACSAEHVDDQLIWSPDLFGQSVAELDRRLQLRDVKISNLHKKQEKLLDDIRKMSMCDAKIV